VLFSGCIPAPVFEPSGFPTTAEVFSVLRDCTSIAAIACNALLIFS
jgi:hypothetical protein